MPATIVFSHANSFPASTYMPIKSPFHLLPGRLLDG